MLKLIIIWNISLKSNALSADHQYFVKHIILKVSKKSVIFIAKRSAKVSNFKFWGSVETLIYLSNVRIILVKISVLNYGV